MKNSSCYPLAEGLLFLNLYAKTIKYFSILDFSQAILDFSNSSSKYFNGIHSFLTWVLFLFLQVLRFLSVCKLFLLLLSDCFLFLKTKSFFL